MPKIHLKPKSAEYAGDKAQPENRNCDMPDCATPAGHRAPKDRALSDYYWFCLDHAREYNSAWNYFSGMSDREVENHIVNSHYGDRPTWRYDLNGSAEDALRRKAWQTYQNADSEPRQQQSNGHGFQGNTPEGQALAIMGLETPITLESIKARYKILVKKHHPDVNRGDPKSEELLKSINMAYTILKLAYEQFKELPDRA